MATRFVLPVTGVLTFYRELRPTARLDRSNAFAALWSGGRYNKITQDNVLLFDRRFDAVVVGDVALFTSKSVFERIFDFVAQMQASARATFTAVTTGLRNDGIDETEAACTAQPAMMASIQRRLDSDPRTSRHEHGQARRLRAEAPRDRRRGRRPRQDGDAPLPPDPRRRFKILLGDDYLASALTNRTYEANSKSDPL